MRTSPRVELLWWEGCPSTQRAVAELRAALADVGLDDVRVWTREITSDLDAHEAGFAGSPTILVDGVDVVGVAPDEPAALNCRVYPRRDGTISPTPDPDDLRDALRRVAARAQAS